MGRVFTFQEIIENRIPELGDFSKVVEEIRGNFDNHRNIVGAVLCGSVASGHYNQRSDIDCLVVYNPSKNHPVEFKLQEINHFANSLNIQIEFIPVAAIDAARRLHTIGHSFFSHLERSAERNGVIKKNPLSLFEFNLIDPRKEVLGYLIDKMQSLEKGLVRMNIMEDAELCRFLQKSLEAPFHVARKILWLMGLKLTDDSSREVVTLYTGRMSDVTLQKLLCQLVQINNFYSDELKKGSLKMGASHSFMRTTIKQNAYHALEFVRANALLIS